MKASRRSFTSVRFNTSRASSKSVIVSIFLSWRKHVFRIHFNFRRWNFQKFESNPKQTLAVLDFGFKSV